MAEPTQPSTESCPPPVSGMEQSFCEILRIGDGQDDAICGEKEEEVQNYVDEGMQLDSANTQVHSDVKESECDSVVADWDEPNTTSMEKDVESGQEHRVKVNMNDHGDEENRQVIKEHQVKANKNGHGDVDDQTANQRGKATKHAPWSKPDTSAHVSPEPAFLMESCTWPTLAEAHLAKPPEVRASKDTSSLPSPPPANQAQPTNSQKHPTANPALSGSNHKPSYKRGNSLSYNRPNSAAGENVVYPPMGKHVANANMHIPNQSMKGNTAMEINGGPYYLPPRNPFYHHAPFQGMQTNGRVNYSLQHQGRGYGSVNAGFWQPFAQPFSLRNTPPSPFMNINMGPYSYPNFKYDPSFMAAAAAAPRHECVGSLADLMQLQMKLRNQIEYYFSTENLCHDVFLTSKMDNEGYVPLSLIASFPRVQALTSDHRLILEALKDSSVVNVQGNDKLRSHDWRRWKPNVPPTNLLRPRNVEEEESKEQTSDGGSSCSEPRRADLVGANIPAVTSISSS